MSTEYSIGLMNQFADTLEKAGFRSNDITKLRSNQGLLKNLKMVLMGVSEIVAIKPIVDCIADPAIPISWRSVVSHIHGEKDVDPTKVVLFLDEEQRDSSIVGKKLYNKLRGDKNVCNANLLEFYLANPQFIPKEWTEKTSSNAYLRVHFWGTIYRNGLNELCVRCLCWNWRDESWNEGYSPLIYYKFKSGHPAAMYAE